MTFTINASHPQASALVELLKTFSFVSFKETKTKTKKTVTREKSVLVEPAFEEESPEDYKFIMALSKETNRNVAHRLAKEKKYTVEDIDEDDYPFIAMYFQYKHRIWSRDKELILGLTEKGFGHFFISTDEIRGHLYKKN